VAPLVRLVLLLCAVSLPAVLPAAAGASITPLPGEVTVVRDVRYGPWPAQRLDVYRPAARPPGRRPLLVWVHGGGFRVGTKDAPRTATMALAFARRGYAVAAIDYRLLASATCAGPPLGSPRCVAAARAAAADARLALRFLRASAGRWGIARNRVAIGGSSAGAIASLLVGTRPRPGAEVRAVVSVAGALPASSGLTPGDPPTLFFNGSADRMVPFRWARRTAAALDGCGVPVRRHVFRGAGHDLWAHREAIAREASAFLAEHLGPARREV
jgi:acetyl esterase/lipase